MNIKMNNTRKNKTVNSRTEIFNKGYDFLKNETSVIEHVNDVASKIKCRECDKELSQDPSCLFCIMGENREILFDLEKLSTILPNQEYTDFLTMISNKKIKKGEILKMKQNKMLASLLASFHYHKCI